MNGGIKPPDSELLIVESLRSNQRLTDPVINVLIQYVLLKTDMKLVKNYVDKIASHWARKEIRTVEEAMEYAKKEHQQYLRWQERKPAPANTVAANRDKLNAKVLELIELYNAGERQDYALGGLETLSDVFCVDLLQKYGIKR
jgi:replication initiation and membrane attachment protein